MGAYVSQLYHFWGSVVQDGLDLQVSCRVSIVLLRCRRFDSCETVRGVFIFFEYNGLSQSKQVLLLQCYRNDITKFIGNTFQSHFSSFQVLLTSRSGSFDVHFKFDRPQSDTFKKIKVLQSDVLPRIMSSTSCLRLSGHFINQQGRPQSDTLKKKCSTKWRSPQNYFLNILFEAVAAFYKPTR